MQEHLSMMEQLVQTQQTVMAAYLGGRASAPAAGLQNRFPFFHDVVENLPGVRAVARHRFSAEREIVFHDHALGRDGAIDGDDGDAGGRRRPVGAG
jgi:hypothetical protein